ncbi:hypothetical protein [Paenibacillus sp. NPDC057934]|uniref:hypothetical protein n=1 Tax=Paenibacillus sp. NPDC057934 TaxID=3346282 RepID=UPI0036DEFCDF
MLVPSWGGVLLSSLSFPHSPNSFGNGAALLPTGDCCYGAARRIVGVGASGRNTVFIWDYEINVVGFTLKEIKAVMEEKKGSKLEISRSIELLREKMLEMDFRKLELEQAQVLLARMLANKLALLKEKQ